MGQCGWFGWRLSSQLDDCCLATVSAVSLMDMQMERKAAPPPFSSHHEGSTLMTWVNSFFLFFNKQTLSIACWVWPPTDWVFRSTSWLLSQAINKKDLKLLIGTLSRVSAVLMWITSLVPQRDPPHSMGLILVARIPGQTEIIGQVPPEQQLLFPNMKTKSFWHS